MRPNVLIAIALLVVLAALALPAAIRSYIVYETRDPVFDASTEAHHFEEKGDYAGAIRILRKQEKEDPDSRLDIFIGHACDLWHRYADAIPAYRQALTDPNLDPEDIPLIHAWLGWDYNRIGDMTDARREANMGLATAPADKMPAAQRDAVRECKELLAKLPAPAGAVYY